MDFEKAFDAIHRPSLWSILSMYGIPEDLTSLVKVMYNNFECAVLEKCETTEWVVCSEAGRTMSVFFSYYQLTGS